jgi:hypothetical protein
VNSRPEQGLSVGNYVNPALFRTAPTMQQLRAKTQAILVAYPDLFALRLGQRFTGPVAQLPWRPLCVRRSSVVVGPWRESLGGESLAA